MIGLLCISDVLFLIRSTLYLSQHEITVAGDVGARVHREQADGEVTASSVAEAMRKAIDAKVVKLKVKLGKFLAVANPELTDGWLHEVVYTHLYTAKFEQHLLFTYCVPDPCVNCELD